MGVPLPSVYYQGQGAVPADSLNTYSQVVANFGQLRTFTGLSNMVVFVLGGASPGDGLQGLFYYNALSTAADNNVTVIVPNGQTVGAWILLFGSIQTALQTQVQNVTLSGPFTTTAQYCRLIRTTGLAVSSTTLPTPPYDGYAQWYEDLVGNFNAFPVTITPSSGTIAGLTQAVLNVNRQVSRFEWCAAANAWSWMA